MHGTTAASTTATIVTTTTTNTPNSATVTTTATKAKNMKVKTSGNIEGEVEQKQMHHVHASYQKGVSAIS